MAAHWPVPPLTAATGTVITKASPDARDDSGVRKPARRLPPLKAAPSSRIDAS